MIVTLYFGFALVLAVLLLISKSRLLTRLVVTFFVVAQILLTLFGSYNPNLTDSSYFSFDATANLFLIILTLICVPVFYHSFIYLERKQASLKHEGKYLATLIILIAAITGAYLSNHLAVLWASIEVTTFATAFLIDFNRTKPGLEAAWKYLFVASVGITLAFMGILFISAMAAHNMVGTLYFSGLAAISENMNPILAKAVFLLFLIGLSIKLNIVPLHAATIDAKTILPSPANALVSTALINVGFIGILRVFGLVVHSSSAEWVLVVMRLTGIISIGLAAIQLFRVKRLKRMLAFSSMEHMGIILIAMSCGKVGYYAAFLHIVLHSFIKAGMFFQAGQVFYTFGSVWFKDSGGFLRIFPAGGLVLFFGLFSVAALPPSGLFVSEILTFIALFEKGYYVSLVVMLLFLTVIIYMIFRFIMGVLFGDNPEGFQLPGKLSVAENISPFVLFSLAAYLGYAQPAFLVSMIESATQFLM